MYIMSEKILEEEINNNNNNTETNIPRIEEDIEYNDKSNDNDINDNEQKVEERLITSNEELLLKLGDIILISDPTNEILNDNVFLIEYIDPSKIKLINSETFEKTTLQISPNGVIGDGTINSIKIISSNPENGYARQNDLLPGTWINIYFGGEIPTVITGKITNLEEDMIEIRTTDDDTLFVNFAYQGIPEDLPIETFEIRPPIKERGQEREEEQGQEREEENQEQKQQDIDYEKEASPEELVELGQEANKMKTTVVKEKIQQMFFDMNDIEFGDVIKVEEFINIDKDKYRFNIESQTNDLLEEMLSTIPNYKRTNNVLNSIHIMITRFLQLREISSTFDTNKNITGIIKRTSEDRPLAEYLSEFKNRLYWIMMVAKNVKKIYPDDKKTEFRRYDDYEMLNLNDDLLEISSLYASRQSNRENNKTRYTSFTFKSFDKYMTPFYSINPELANDVFAEPNGIIIEGNVETDVNAIIDNLGDFYSTVVGNSELTNRRFVIQKYNLALEKLEPINLKGSKMIAHRVKVANNDPISINSIVTLPEPTVRFSQVNLPGSNLLVKANLNLRFLNYWQLLKQKTSLTRITIDGLDNELEYDDTNFVDNIKQYLLDLTEYEKPEQLTNLDIYKIFLRTIIPKIRVLFILVKKYIKGRLSLVDVVNYLEPFMIYPIDLTYMQYNEINKFIYGKIKEYNIRFKEYGMAFSSLRYGKFQSKIRKDKDTYYFSNPLFDIIGLKPDFMRMNNEIMDLYGYSESNKMQISGSEFLKNIIVSDSGNLYNTAAAFTNIDLMFPSNLTEIFNKDKDQMKSIIEKDKTTDKCISYVIAKKYYAEEALLNDNNKQIYYDKDYDTTNYELINEKYKKQREQLDTEDFIIFLTDEFKIKNKMDENSAEYMANTLVNQAKKVREGDYAILLKTYESIPEQLEYYVRRDDMWVLDTNIDPALFIKEDDVLCNINYNCIYNSLEKSDDKCVSTDVSKDTIVQNALKQIIDQFDSQYDISKAELNTHINKQFEYFQKIFEKLKQMKDTQFYKYNNQKYDLGLNIADNIKDQVISPYKKLRDLIMGQNDFIKRQNDILKFVSLYCYEGNPSTPNIIDGEMENEWWLYCKETNTKLLPKFYFILASTFINYNSKYDEILDQLKRTIGKISDDGDAWVDEHSGEIICFIDLDVTEGYKDGFIDKSRNILEKDSGEIMLEKQQEKKSKRLSPEGEIISNVVSILSANMGIELGSNGGECIIRIVTELMSDTKIIEKEPAYRKREEDAAKKGKKLPSYGTVYASTIMYLTLGMFLISIQTTIPSIKTRKTAPGCVRSFVGFPFEGEGDDSSLNYVACVALKSRDASTIPWNILPKNEDKIASIIKSFTIKYLLPYGEVEQKIKEKTEYLLLNPEEEIPVEHDLSKWKNFLPPLKRFHIKSLENISEGFRDELQNELYIGSYRQLEKLLVIETKIISYSLAIQECIQKIIEKKNLLLKSSGQLFMDNACCNETGNTSITTLQYFINDDNSIELYNYNVANLTALLHDIKLLTESAIMLSEINTKRVFPVISSDFSEETIYQAFIKLCKFQSSIPLTDDLAAVCIDKPDYLKRMDTIHEKIAKLKRDGRNYTNSQFLRLFQIVSRNNIIKLSFGKNMSCVTNLKKVLVSLDEDDNEDVPKALTQKLENLIETYDLNLEEDTKEMRILKDYLQISIDKMRKELLEFIRLKAKVSSAELRNLTKFINEISIWNFEENVRNVDNKISDDGFYNHINFMKNYIELFVVVFPSMIINQNIQTINPPKYWGLAKDHANDVKEMVSEYYVPIEKFYGDDTIKNILNEIMLKSRGIYLLSQNTPGLTSIKMGEKELYNVFDKRTVVLLYEYYFFSIFTDYIYLTRDPSMVSRMLVIPERGEQNLFSTDFLIEQQLRFTETEQEYIEGDVMKLNQSIAKLLVSYLSIIMRAKKTINVSYSDVEDKVFKLREAEKYDFTDKLRDLTDEARAVDTILKHHKLGPLYSLGLSKGIKEYDPEHFEHDKKIAENVTKIQNRLKRSQIGSDDVDLDMEDAIYEMNVERDVEMDIAINMNLTEDFDNGDPWGDEEENYGDYD